jgi:hypothetical protein
MMHRALSCGSSTGACGEVLALAPLIVDVLMVPKSQPLHVLSQHPSVPAIEGSAADNVGQGLLQAVSTRSSPAVLQR